MRAAIQLSSCRLSPLSTLIVLLRSDARGASPKNGPAKFQYCELVGLYLLLNLLQKVWISEALIFGEKEYKFQLSIMCV